MNRYDNLKSGLHKGSPSCLGVSPDGKWAATGSEGGDVNIYAVENAKLVHRIE